jgi:potassium-transporting ATPase potassium-binding subunit
MTFHSLVQIVAYFGALIVLSPFLGRYMAKVYSGERHMLLPVLGPVERFILRLTGARKETEDTWWKYTLDLVWFNLIGILFVLLLQMVQRWLPLNPQKLPNVPWHLALNTAISFVTNTNWQSYAGETTLSYLVQMTALTVQNFVSAATGMAVMIALIRGITRKSATTVGSFRVDLTRSVLYILLPLSIIFAIVLAGEGVIQNFHPNTPVTTLEGVHQLIPGGPVASQIAIKQLGTNGGGYFNANSAHPFENPTPVTNFLEMLAILLIPAAMTFMYGRMAGARKEGWTLFSAMLILCFAGLAVSLWSEYHGYSLFHGSHLMEGKETRFGVDNSILWSVATTDASNGSVNAMHDSFTPLSGLVALFNIMLGEVIFGGVGCGLYGMILFVILTVFIAGLMVGRTPEYLGKKIGAFEVQMAIIAILLPSAVILFFSAIACTTAPGLAGLNNAGPHGFSEILYAYSSAAGNNGSTFAGLNANTPFYNLTIGFAMLVGRFGVLIPVMAIAGSLVRKKITPVSSGTFRTDNWLFIILLIGVIIIVGGLTFFPALSLGPVMEHFLLVNHIVF